MNSCLRFVRLFVTAACLSQALVVGAFAQDQTSAVVPERQIAQPAPQTVITSGKEYRIETKTVTKSEFTIFADFIDDIGAEDLQFKRESGQGKHPVLGKTSFSKVMGIREDEEQDMRTIFLDAFYRIGEIYRQINQTVNESDDARRRGDQSSSRELKSKLDALDQEPPKIYQEAITKVKDILGDQTFSKVLEYLYRRDGKPKTTKIITYIGPVEQHGLKPQ